MKGLIVAALLLLPSVCQAKCPPCPDHKVHRHAAKPCTTVVATPKKDEYLGKSLLEGFGITAGFRWDREVVCPDFAPVTHEQKDPFFLGLELRAPLTEHLDYFGNVDRDVWNQGDVIEKAHWNTRVGLAWKPFAK